MKKDVFALCCLAIAMLACACARNDRSIEAAKAEAAEKAWLAEYDGLQAATDDDFPSAEEISAAKSMSRSVDITSHSTDERMETVEIITYELDDDQYELKVETRNGREVFIWNGKKATAEQVARFRKDLSGIFSQRSRLLDCDGAEK